MSRKTKKSYQKFQIRLSPWDRKKVEKLVHLNQVSARTLKRALILRLLDQEQTVLLVAKELGVDPMTIRNVGRRYLDGGLDEALNDVQRPGRPVEISNSQEKEIIALVCSAPPGERARWTLGLLQEEVIRRKIRASIGRETLRLIITEAEVKPWLEKNVVRGNSDRRVHQTNDGRSSPIREEIRSTKARRLS